MIERSKSRQKWTCGAARSAIGALTEAIASIVWVASADGSMIDIAAWHAITGQSDQECSGWGWLNALHPSDRLRVGEAWHRSVERLDLYDIEYRVRCQDGSYHWYNARGVPVRNGDGTVREWVGVCIDIEGRKAAEERQILLMAELDHRVRNILASIAAMVSLTAQGAATKEEYARRLHGRIGTMARTHGLLTQQKWKGANLHRLVQDELAIYGRAPESITIGGEPADFIRRDCPQPLTDPARTRDQRGEIRGIVGGHRAGIGDLDPYRRRRWRQSAAGLAGDRRPSGQPADQDGVWLHPNR